MRHKMVKTEKGFVTYYREGSYEKSIVYYYEHGNKIELYSRCGNVRTLPIPPKVKLSIYNHQFGITISEASNVLFIQIWERGLFAIDINSGDIRWHVKKVHAYELCLHNSYVYCRFLEDSICRIDINTGLVLQRMAYGSGQCCVFIKNHGVFIGPVRGKYRLVSFEFDTMYSWSADVLNKNKKHTFIIRDADIVDNKLIIYGWEDDGIQAKSYQFAYEYQLS